MRGAFNDKNHKDCPRFQRITPEDFRSVRKIRATHGEKRSAIQRQVCQTTKGCAWVHDERPNRQRAPCTLARPMAAMADPAEHDGQPVQGGQALTLSGHPLKRSGAARKQKGTPGPTQIGPGTSTLTFIASCVPSIRLAVNGIMQGSPQTRCGASPGVPRWTGQSWLMRTSYSQG